MERLRRLRSASAGSSSYAGNAVGKFRSAERRRELLLPRADRTALSVSLFLADFRPFDDCSRAGFLVFCLARCNCRALIFFLAGDRWYWGAGGWCRWKGDFCFRKVCFAIFALFSSDFSSLYNGTFLRSIWIVEEKLVNSRLYFFITKIYKLSNDFSVWNIKLQLASLKSSWIASGIRSSVKCLDARHFSFDCQS